MIWSESFGQDPVLVPTLICCLFSAQEPSTCGVCFVSQPPCPSHPWRRSKVSFSTPVPDLLPLGNPLTLPCNAEMSGKEGARRVVAARLGTEGKVTLYLRWGGYAKRFVERVLIFLEICGACQQNETYFGGEGRGRLLNSLASIPNPLFLRQEKSVMLHLHHFWLMFIQSVLENLYWFTACQHKQSMTIIMARQFLLISNLNHPCCLLSQSLWLSTSRESRTRLLQPFSSLTYLKLVLVSHSLTLIPPHFSSN